MSHPVPVYMVVTAQESTGGVSITLFANFKLGRSHVNAVKCINKLKIICLSLALSSCSPTGNLTKCEQQLQDAYKRAKVIDGARVFPPGMFVPECNKKDGSFSPMQCHGSTGSCFCVNENGSEVPHTRVRYRKPECKRSMLFLHLGRVYLLALK